MPSALDGIYQLSLYQVVSIDASAYHLIIGILILLSTMTFKGRGALA